MVSCIESEPKRTVSASREKEKLLKPNTNTQGADIRSLFT